MTTKHNYISPHIRNHQPYFISPLQEAGWVIGKQEHSMQPRRGISGSTYVIFQENNKMQEREEMSFWLWKSKICGKVEFPGPGLL